MNDTFEEKLVRQCRRAISKHPLCKYPVMLYFILAMLLYRVYVLFASHLMKLASISVLFVFFIISCSFCTPVLQIAEQAVTETGEQTEAAEIGTNSSSAFDQSSMNGSNPQKSEVLQESTEVESANGDAELAGNTDKYSIDEILENSTYTNADGTSQKSADGTVSGNDMVADTQKVFHKTDWNLILINKQHPIPEDYQFDLGTITGNLQCDERIIPDLLDMLKQAKQDGIDLTICSPYRNLEHQQQLFEKKINIYMTQDSMSYLEAYKLASQAVTVPGASEHQVGLALDIYTPTYKNLDAGFGNTEAGKWLAAHCSEFGFILRYPEGKEYVTGIEYEPWHFRYVGKEAAQEITSQQITLEEFVNSL